MRPLATTVVLVVLLAGLAPAALARGPALPTNVAAASPPAAPAPAAPQSILYSWDFESNSGGFAGTQDWEWGAFAWDGSACDSAFFPPPAAHSGSSMWGTVLNNCYRNLGNNSGYDTCVNGNPADDSILSFAIDLTGVTAPVELSWWEWFDLFMDWDWAEVYANGNVVFQHCGGGFVQPTEWQRQAVDLSPYSGGPVNIEFHMMASTVVNHAGWYIDDVMVRTTLDAWKEAPALAKTGDVISYTIVVSVPVPVGLAMTDPLPPGVAYAGNLTSSAGLAWYNDLDNTVNWVYEAPKMASVPTAPAAPLPGVHDPAAVADRVGGVEPAAPAPDSRAATWTRPEAVLWDNGPLVTHPGGGAGGADASALQSALSMNTYGFGNQLLQGYRMADDFEVTDPLGWQIDTITFFAYQTGSPTSPSPITGVYYQIWDGPPDDPGSSIIWGDLTTNQLLSSVWSNVYRVIDTDLLGTTRPIMANVSAAGVLLPAGTYWFDWTTDGSLASGPWAPPITILGQTTTGNAMHYTTAWGPAQDTGTLTPQGMAFVVEGTVVQPPRFEISFDVTVTALCGAVIVNQGSVSQVGGVQPFSAATEVVGDAAISVAPLALQAVLLPDTTATQQLDVCNQSDCLLHWAVYEVPPLLAGSGSPYVPVGVSGQAANPGLTTASPHVQPVAAPASAPEAVLWDQPLSTVAQDAYVNQEFPDYPSYSSFLADDFTNTDYWLVQGVFIPGDGWNGFSTLLNATALTWQLYADCAGVPCGDPAGGGSPPVWTLTLPPSHPRVHLTAGTPGGYPSNVQLTLPMPGVLPPGTWWFVFYPTMDFVGPGQYGRQPSDTTNGYTGQFINPGGGFGYGTTWQDWTVIGPTLQDIAFRIEGLVVSVTDVPWLSESPLTGTVPADTCQPVDVTFDATGMTPGEYHAGLSVVSNDPYEPQVFVPVTLKVVSTYSVYLPLVVRQ